MYSYRSNVQALFTKILLLLVVSLLMMNCAKQDEASTRTVSKKSKLRKIKESALYPEFTPNAATKEPIGNIHFDSLIQDEVYNDIATNLHILRHTSFDSSCHSSSWAISTMGDLTDITSDSLVRWLEDRVQFIVNKNFRQTSVPDNVRADNFGCPVFRIAAQTNEENRTTRRGNPYTSVETPNFGIFSLPIPEVSIPGIGQVRITSPRTGIIRLGHPLRFAENDDIFLAEVFINLAILFHEGRHSDGNGPSLCFSHIHCPPGHPYAAQAACDANSNGPYSVQAAFLKVAKESCQNNCNIRDNEVLRLSIADALGRLRPGSHWDATPASPR